MRIIAGRAKGRKLASPKGLDTRPLTGRAREALFSSLGSVVVDAKVLDLFAGSGSIGLEALSRGARSAVFVERNAAAVAVLEKNVEALGLGGEVVCGDVARLGQLIPGRAGFDLVFVDPPYATSAEEVTAILRAVSDVVVSGAQVIVHRRAGDRLAESIESLSATSQRRYGDSELWSYQATEEVRE